MMDWMQSVLDDIEWGALKRSQAMYPGRNELPDLLSDNWHRLAQHDKAGALIEAWHMAEWPLRLVDADFWRHMIEELTGGYGELFLDYGEDEQYETVVNLLETKIHLPEKIRLHRGCVKGHEFSMSWTSDEPTAEWFGKRFDHIFGHPVIVTAEIPREYIYARVLNARHENEYIIDPAVFELEDFKHETKEL